LFTSYGVKHLRLFYQANCIIPGLVVLLSSFFERVETESIVMVVLHFTLGVFAWFFAAIFKQGVQLQNEQDLYI
jgi:RsiW-degrading membrane proteinase PrsW (M82 family)